MMVAGTPTDKAVDLPVVTAERSLRHIFHTLFLGHRPGK
jgi:hypothetical protein